MPTSVPDAERQSLERADRRIADWKEEVWEQAERLVREHADAIDSEQVRLFVKTTKHLAMRLDESLAPSLDPAAVAEIRGILLGGLRRLEDAEQSDEYRPLDVLDDFMVRAESIRHIIRDLLDEDVGGQSADAGVLTRQLLDWLPRVSQKAVADLVGVDVRTVQRWRRRGGRAPRRLDLVARLVAILHRAWTPEGVVAWFYRPRLDLADARPIDLLEDPTFEQRLIAAVRTGRAQHGQ